MGFVGRVWRLGAALGGGECGASSAANWLDSTPGSGQMMHVQRPQHVHGYGHQLEAHPSRPAEVRRGFELPFDTCGLLDHFKAASAEKQQHAVVVRVRCSKCDQAHRSEQCPHFRSAREEHEDSWQHYTGSAKAAAAQKSRECAAPRRVSRQSHRVVRMPGDGACLFHSLAFGLHRLGYRQEDGLRIRSRVARFMYDNPEFKITGTPLRSWIAWDSHVSVDSYVERLASGRVWGGAIEMAAVAEIFQVDVVVYEKDYFGGVQRISDFLTDKQPRGVVTVMYSGRNHYDALEQDGPSVGVQTPRAGYDAPEPEEGEDSSCAWGVM